MRGVPPNRTAQRTAAAIVLLALTIPAVQAADSAAHDFDGLRRQCIAAAAVAQERERVVGRIAHTVYLLGRDLDGRRRGLADSRAEQARLLGRIEVLQRSLDARPALLGADPLDRRRGERLIAATVPELRGEARALGNEYRRAGALRREIAAREGELAGARAALASDRARLTELGERRLAAARGLIAMPAGDAARLAALGRDTSDLADLIKRADDVLERARKPAAADPTKPTDAPVFAPPQTKLSPPVSGPVAHAFGAADEGSASQGLRFDALPGAGVIAPFDGRVTYAAPFRDRGVVLIIRHGGLYHSVLAGLGRADVVPGEWLTAGEPVGVMPEAPSAHPDPQQDEDAAAASSRPLYFELRHDGRPVDPQPWLAAPAEGRDKQTGEQRVRE